MLMEISFSRCHATHNYASVSDQTGPNIFTIATDLLELNCQLPDAYQTNKRNIQGITHLALKHSDDIINLNQWRDVRSSRAIRKNVKWLQVISFMSFSR